MCGAHMRREPSVIRANVCVPWLHVRHFTHFKDFISYVSYAPNMLLTGGLEAKNRLGWHLKDCPTPSILAQGLPALPMAIGVGGWENRKDVAGEACHIQSMSSGSGTMCTVKSGGSWLPGLKVKWTLGTCGRHIFR